MKFFKNIGKGISGAVKAVAGAANAVLGPAVQKFGELQVAAVTAVGGKKAGEVFKAGQKAFGGAIQKGANLAVKAATLGQADYRLQDLKGPKALQVVGNAYGAAFGQAGELALKGAIPGVNIQGELGALADAAKAKVADLPVLRSAREATQEWELKAKAKFPRLWK